MITNHAHHISDHETRKFKMQNILSSLWMVRIRVMPLHFFTKESSTRSIR